MAKEDLLVIAPHPDDEVLGVGGMMAKYAKQGFRVTVLTIAGHRPPLYTEEAYLTTVREAKAAHALIGVHKSDFLGIPATMVRELKSHELNGMIEFAIDRLRPSMVMIPYPDRHIDHQIIFESALAATRPVKAGRDIEILAAYETLSGTHWNAAHIEPNFTPNWICEITDYIDIKIEALKCFASQVTPFPGARSIEALKALSIFRGTQAGFAHGEAFHILRMRT